MNVFLHLYGAKELPRVCFTTKKKIRKYRKTSTKLFEESKIEFSKNTFARANIWQYILKKNPKFWVRAFVILVIRISLIFR